MSKRVEEVKKKTPAKRVEIVSLRVVKDLELIREGSIDYLPRKMSCPQDVVGRDTGTGQSSQSSDWFLRERDRIERFCLSFFFCFFVVSKFLFCDLV